MTNIEYPPLPSIISKQDLCYILNQVKKRGPNKGKYSLKSLNAKCTTPEFVEKFLKVDPVVYRRLKIFNYVQTQIIYTHFKITPKRYYLAFLPDTEKQKFFNFNTQ